MYEPYKWEFNKEVAECFDSHVRQSVFMYDEFHKSIINMSRFFIEDNTNILDIGTSTGELLKKLPYNDTCKYIGIDVEKDMVEKAREKLDDNYTLNKKLSIMYIISLIKVELLCLLIK